MKKQVSSVEMSYIVEELQELIGSRIDKIYHSKNSGLHLQFYVRNTGKKILKIIEGKYLYLTKAKDESEKPSGFCMFLRKHLDNSIIKEINQIKPERIIEFIFEKAGKKYVLLAEFLSKGNIIFCDEKYTIINALEFVDFSTRSIKPKIKYEHPKMNYNLFKLSKEDLENVFKNSIRDNIVKCLAVDLGLGGIYSEEVCLLSELDKNKDTKEISKDEINSILNSIKGFIHKKINPFIYYKDKEAVDVFPFELEYYKNYDKKKCKTFNDALDDFFLIYKEKKLTKHDIEIQKINRIIEEQKTKIEKLKEQEIENKKRGELIYNKYQIIDEILKEINKASKKYSWKEIKEKLKDHKIIKEINTKEKKVVVEVE